MFVYENYMAPDNEYCVYTSQEIFNILLTRSQIILRNTIANLPLMKCHGILDLDLVC
jgi:hypothetical protein